MKLYIDHICFWFSLNIYLINRTFIFVWKCMKLIYFCLTLQRLRLGIYRIHIYNVFWSIEYGSWQHCFIINHISILAHKRLKQSTPIFCFTLELEYLRGPRCAWFVGHFWIRFISLFSFRFRVRVWLASNKTTSVVQRSFVIVFVYLIQPAFRPKMIRVKSN